MMPLQILPNKKKQEKKKNTRLLRSQLDAQSRTTGSLERGHSKRSTIEFVIPSDQAVLCAFRERTHVAHVTQCSQKMKTQTSIQL